MMSFALISIPFAMAALVLLVGPRIPRYRLNWMIASVLFALFAWLITWIGPIAEGGPIVSQVMWVEPLGLSLELYVDGLALLFALLITGIGSAVFLYAGYYLEDPVRAPLFFAILLAFTGSMLGIVLAGNLLLLFVFWELTSVTSFALISFDRDDPAARRSGLQALVVTAGGGLALLVGLVLLGAAGGSWSMATLVQTPLHGHPLYTAIVILVALGCFTKSAQWPFHFWLPAGMTAPTPASAFLHSATMVKAGVFLLARLYPVLGYGELWSGLLTAVGLITMLVGSFTALRQVDLKGMLAFATVSWLGALVLMLGQPAYHGYLPALLGIVAHALYKSPLFMVAGTIDHATGTRDIRRIAGLARRMPTAAGISIISGLSMAGIIPLLGFVAKELLLESILEAESRFAPLLLLGVVIGATFTVTAALILIWDPFFRKEPVPFPGPGSTSEAPHADATHSPHFHAPGRLMLLGPALIAALTIVTGLGIETLIAPLLGLMDSHADELHLFNGFNSAFALSMTAIAGGVALFLTRNRWRQWPRLTIPSGTAIYNGAIGGVERLGSLLLRTQDGKVTHYLAVILGVVGVLLVLPGSAYLTRTPLVFELGGSADVLKAVLLLLALAATFASIIFKQHLLAALALGVSGYAVGGIFLLEPAPDVAMVQVLVETLSAVLIIVMLTRISETKRRRATAILWGNGPDNVARDVVIATLVGAAVGVFALAAASNRPQRNSELADWYTTNAYERAGVTDIVGAIVTDFRGTDTALEITVFSMAALGVLTVLYLSRELPPGATPAREPTITEISTPLTRLGATLSLPFAFVLAMAYLLYAGDAPGDGFSAGVIGGISLALWYAVFGYQKTRQRIGGLRPEFLIGSGLLLAFLNAGLPVLFGGSFLQHNDFGDIPLPAGIHFSSTTLFEIAIMVTVFGSVVNILNAITNPEGRATK